MQPANPSSIVTTPQYEEGDTPELKEARSKWLSKKGELPTLSRQCFEREIRKIFTHGFYNISQGLQTNVSANREKLNAAVTKMNSAAQEFFEKCKKYENSKETALQRIDENVKRVESCNLDFSPICFKPKPATVPSLYPLHQFMQQPQVKAEAGANGSVIYYDKDGNQIARSKDSKGQPASTRSWRNNNPGNHVLTPLTKKLGAIGGAGNIPGNKNLKFAVYPDYETGRKAQLSLITKPMYINSTLKDFVRKYTGVKAGAPDTQEVINYRNAIKSFTQFDMDRTMGSLSDEERGKLLDAMQKHEGWREGQEKYLENQ